MNASAIAHNATCWQPIVNKCDWPALAHLFMTGSKVVQYTIVTSIRELTLTYDQFSSPVLRFMKNVHTLHLIFSELRKGLKKNYGACFKVIASLSKLRQIFVTGESGAHPFLTELLEKHAGTIPSVETIHWQGIHYVSQDTTLAPSQLRKLPPTITNLILPQHCINASALCQLPKTLKSFSIRVISDDISEVDNNGEGDGRIPPDMRSRLTFPPQLTSLVIDDCHVGELIADGYLPQSLTEFSHRDPLIDQKWRTFPPNLLSLTMELNRFDPKLIQMLPSSLLSLRMHLFHKGDGHVVAHKLLSLLPPGLTYLELKNKRHVYHEEINIDDAIHDGQHENNIINILPPNLTGLDIDFLPMRRGKFRLPPMTAALNNDQIRKGIERVLEERATQALCNKSSEPPPAREKIRVAYYRMPDALPEPSSDEWTSICQKPLVEFETLVEEEATGAYWHIPDHYKHVQMHMESPTFFTPGVIMTLPKQTEDIEISCQEDDYGYGGADENRVWAFAMCYARGRIGSNLKRLLSESEGVRMMDMVQHLGSGLEHLAVRGVTLPAHPIYPHTLRYLQISHGKDPFMAQFIPASEKIELPYAGLLQSLPKSLTHLNIADAGAIPVDVYVSVPLPPHLTALNMKINIRNKVPDPFATLLQILNRLPRNLEHLSVDIKCDMALVLGTPSARLIASAKSLMPTLLSLSVYLKLPRGAKWKMPLLSKEIHGAMPVRLRQQTFQRIGQGILIGEGEI